MGRGAWWAAVHGVTKSQTRLSNFTSTFHFGALEKGMATHSSILAWKIPWVQEPVAGYSPWGHKESRLRDFTFFLFLAHRCSSAWLLPYKPAALTHHQGSQIAPTGLHDAPEAGTLLLMVVPNGIP